MKKLLLALLCLWAGPAFAQTSVVWGNYLGNVCVYDTSATRPCVTVGSLNTTTHTFTYTGPATLSAPTSLPITATIGTGTVAASSGTLANGHCVSINSSGQFVDAGGACTVGGGGGTVNSATIGQLAVYTGATAVSGATMGGDCTFTSPNITCTKLNGFTATLGGMLSTAGTFTTAANTAFAGAFPVILTSTASTNVTLPTSGTLATTSGVTTSISSAVNTALPSGAASSGLVYAPTGAAGAAAVTSDMVGFRNRIINGDDRIDQRNSYASQTITAGAALAYTDDRFYVYSTGANVTGTDTNIGSTLYPREYSLVGAASVTGIWRCQRIENSNSADLAGGNATFSVSLSDSLLTTVNWQIWYANTDNAFGTVASPTVTSISSGSFTVNSTLTRYSATVAIPAAATTGLQVCLSVGAQTSGNFISTNWQLEPGSFATPFERRFIGDELALAQRYYQLVSASARFPASAASQYNNVSIGFQVSPRTTPVVTLVTAPSTNLATSYIMNNVTTSGARFELLSSAAGDCYAINALYSISAEL